MKSSLQLLLVSLSVLTGSCASSPSSDVLSAADNYRAIHREMTRDSVYRQLGEPQTKMPGGFEKWHVSDGRHTSELLLRFSPGGEILEIEQHYPMAE